MENKFEIIVPLVPPTAYYIFRGKQVTEKEFSERQFEELLITDISSSVHTYYLKPSEIIERFSDTLTAEQLADLREHEQKAKEYAKR